MRETLTPGDEAPLVNHVEAEQPLASNRPSSGSGGPALTGLSPGVDTRACLTGGR
jgi:hypothetical protein